MADIGVRVYENQGEITFELNSKKKIQVKNYKGTVLIDLREYWFKDDKSLPTKKGVCITDQLWSKFKAVIPHIDEAIENMKQE